MRLVRLYFSRSISVKGVLLTLYTKGIIQLSKNIWNKIRKIQNERSLKFAKIITVSLNVLIARTFQAKRWTMINGTKWKSIILAGRTVIPWFHTCFFFFFFFFCFCYDKSLVMLWDSLTLSIMCYNFARYLEGINRSITFIKSSNLPKICMNLKELEQYWKNYQKVPKSFSNFLNWRGGGVIINWNAW